MDSIYVDLNPHFDMDCQHEIHFSHPEMVVVVNGKDGANGKDGKDGQNATGDAIIDYDEQMLRAFYNNITN